MPHAPRQEVLFEVARRMLRGHSMPDEARRIGISYQALHARMKAAGLPTKRPKGVSLRPPTSRAERVHAAREAGMTWKKIGEREGITYQAAQNLDRVWIAYMNRILGEQEHVRHDQSERDPLRRADGG